MFSWLFGVITKLILPVVICIVINEIIVHNRFHFKSRNHDEYPYVVSTAIALSAIGLFNLVLDLFYIFGIKSIGLINRAVDYFIVNNHKTIYSMIRFGLKETPIRTRIFIVYLIVAGITIITVIWSTVYYSLREERRI